jgi:hypothetical protein
VARANGPHEKPTGEPVIFACRVLLYRCLSGQMERRMIDPEVKTAIIDLCETLEASLQFFADLNHSVVALSNVVLKDPETKRRYRQEWESVTLSTAHSLGPDISERLRKIRALSQKMKD